MLLPYCHDATGAGTGGGTPWGQQGMAWQLGPVLLPQPGAG